MNFIKRFFCKHEYAIIKNDYMKIGYERCCKCDKEIYTGKNTTGTSFKLIEIIYNPNNK